MLTPRNDEYLDAAGRIELDYANSGLHASRTTYVDTLGYGLWVGKYVEYYQTLGHENAIRKVQNEIAEIEGRPLPFPPPPIEPLRPGRVRLEGRAMSDDLGAWLPVGASLFWAVRGVYDGEQQRVRDNALWLRERGVDFVRVFADTTDWGTIACTDGTTQDRRTDPRWPTYEACLRETVGIFADHGLRIAWTIFGGNKLTQDERRRCVDVLHGVCCERPEMVQYLEISNEDNGHLSPEEYREYAALFRDDGFVVALTSVAHHGALYEGSPANVATCHFDRLMTENGWRPVRQPWGYPAEYGAGLPDTFISGEPVGPGSSVASDTDPERVAMAAVQTWICGGCAHVVHFGGGIFGVPTTHHVGGARPANVWEQVALEDILNRIAAYRLQLPLDLPNWQRTRHGRPDHPFTFPPDPLVTVGDGALARGQGCVRGYATYRGGQYVCAPIGIMGSLDLAPQHAAGGMTLYERDGRSRIIAGEYR